MAPPKKKKKMGRKAVARVSSLTPSGLTEMEKFMAEDIVYQCFTGMTLDEIATKYGMSVTALQKHRTKQPFVDEINKLSAQLHKSYRADVDNAVREIIATGDHRTKLKAAELFYKQTGCFNDKSSEDIVNTDDLDIEDIMLELQRSLPVYKDKTVEIEVEAEEVEYEECEEDIMNELLENTGYEEFEDSVNIEEVD
jgi:hypothetical protein